MVKMPHFDTSCLETGIKTLVTEMGQQLPPSIIILYFLDFDEAIFFKYPRMFKKKMAFWAVRNCDTVDHREKYVEKLQKYVDVDIYSSVSNSGFF